MNFNLEGDWARFLKKYIDMEGVLYVDPAWQVPMKVAYPTQTLSEIRKMPVKHVFKRGICYLWVIESLLDEGIRIMREWGFEYKATNVWVKTDEDHYVQDFMGRWFLHPYEHCLIGVKGKVDDLAAPFKNNT